MEAPTNSPQDYNLEATRTLQILVDENIRLSGSGRERFAGAIQQFALSLQEVTDAVCHASGAEEASADHVVTALSGLKEMLKTRDRNQQLSAMFAGALLGVSGTSLASAFVFVTTGLHVNAMMIIAWLCVCILSLGAAFLLWEINRH